MRSNVLTNPVQAVIPGDEVVFSGELPLQLSFLLFVQVGTVANLRDVLC